MTSRRGAMIEVEQSANLMTQISQGADDAIITPAWILAGELQHQPFDLDRDGWPSRFGLPSVGEIPFPGDQAAMPFEQGFRLHNGDDVVQPLAGWFAFLGEDLALSIPQAPVG